MPTDPNDLSSQTAPLKTELRNCEGLARWLRPGDDECLPPLRRRRQEA